jgi:hypothetical protein
MHRVCRPSFETNLSVLLRMRFGGKGAVRSALVPTSAFEVLVEGVLLDPTTSPRTTASS